MELPLRRRGHDPSPQNLLSPGTLTDAIRNDLSSSFNGAGISNAGGNFHVLGSVNINSNASLQSISSKEQNRKDLMESLRFAQIDARHDDIKNAHAKTCRWLLETDTYNEWEATGSSNTHNFLWIKGKPGAGKSTIMKFVHRHIRARTRQNRSNEILISFFFNARGHQLEKSTIGLYRSLLWQLLAKRPGLQLILDDIYPGYQWTVESLKSLLEEVIQELGETPIFCLIDALDECDQDQIRDMVYFLEALVDSQTSLHICFASRHYPYITIQASFDIILEEREGHEQDITAYLGSVLRIKPEKLAEQLRSEVQEKANGVFIWVVLVVEILNKEYDSGRKFKLRERLQELPKNLHQLFRDILTRDTRNRAGLLLCIQWILFAKEPLTPKQLYLAILSGTEPEFLPQCHSEPCFHEDLERYILDNSKGLAQPTKQSSFVPTVQFIHESVRDFLLEENGLGELFTELGPNIRGESHEALKNCCLTYMRLEALTEIAGHLPGPVMGTFSFLGYANDGILYHANEAARHGISQESFCSTFPRSLWVDQQNVIGISKGRRYKSHVSLLYILAEAGSSELIRAHSCRQSCFEIEDERHGVPILAASASEHESAVQVMLELQAERIPEFDFANFCKRLQRREKASHRPNRTFEFMRQRGLVEQLIEYGDDRVTLFYLETETHGLLSMGVNLTPLLGLACQHGRFESAELLLQYCTEITTAVDEDTPLHHASSYGDAEIAKFLIYRGADIMATSRFGYTPLHYAARSNSCDVARLIIDFGADISATDIHGNTPLHDAAREGSLQVAQLVLDHGADALAVNKSGNNTLHEAAQNGHWQVVQMLLDRNVDLPSTGQMQRTLLRLASTSHLETIQLLLDHGVAISTIDASGNTPLHIASSANNFRTTQLLLDHGADISAINNSGETPLHRASESYLHGDAKMVKLLLARGGDISVVNHSGQTPLHNACRCGRDEIVELLINYGADIRVSDESGRTPLHYACQYTTGQFNPSIHMVRLLINHGANASATTKTGETPLDYLLRLSDLSGSRKQYLRFATMDEYSGADNSSPDRQGRSPLELELSKELMDLVEYLRSCGSKSSASSFSSQGREEN